MYKRLKHELIVTEETLFKILRPYNVKQMASKPVVKLTVGGTIFFFQIPYFPAHKTHRDFFVVNFRKK